MSQLQSSSTEHLVNGTPRYPDKKAFCPDTEWPVNEDWCPVNKDYPQSLLSGLNTDLSRLTGVRLTGTKFCPDNERPVKAGMHNSDFMAAQKNVAHTFAGQIG